MPAATGLGEGPIRDGSDGNTPDPNNPNGARGLHEPTSFYQACDARERNKGLYTADQNVGNNNGARNTRQNPNGARSGLECPEERDYYPYWAPTPWKDAMIMTNNLRLCPFYQSESQNVKARGYCANGNADGNGANKKVANNPDDCATQQGTWTLVPPFGLEAPACVAAPWQRDNHLGNGISGYEVMANLSLPFGQGPLEIDPTTGNQVKSDDADRCVYRLRYNITTADTRVCEDKELKTKAECEAAICDTATARNCIWSAMFLDSTYDDSTLSSTPPLPEGNPDVDMGGFLKDGDDNGAANDGSDSLLELAVNTNQYGRTFQDRTHVFSVQSRPDSLPANAKIVNLNVKGKRGNIVQTYPAHEYDFHPTDLVVGLSDYVHIQWTGNDNTNNNGNNNGEGTNNEDRHNIVQISDAGMDVPMPASQASMFDVQWEWNPETKAGFSGPRNKDVLTKQFALVKQTNCLAESDINGDQQRQNCKKLNAADATIDLGLLKFKPGNYTYMSSRNNNFSNRAQKAKLKVLDVPSAPVSQPVNVQAVPVPTDNPSVSSMRVSWAPPGSATGYVDTDTGKVMWGKDQDAVNPAAYSVQYTTDGGESWTPVEKCQSSATECTVDNLPAGATIGFKVHSGSEAGWGPPSETVLAVAPGAGCTCRKADPLITSCGQDVCYAVESFPAASDCDEGGMPAAAIVAIVFLVLAGVALFGFLFTMVRRQQPPPPPPGLYKPEY